MADNIVYLYKFYKFHSYVSPRLFVCASVLPSLFSGGIVWSFMIYEVKCYVNKRSRKLNQIKGKDGWVTGAFIIL